MPLQIGQKPIAVRVTVEDRDRNQSSVEVNFPNSVSIVDLITNVAVVESGVAALSDGFIVGGSITIPLIQSTAFSAPPETSDVERKAVLVFDTANAASFAKLEVPSCDNTLIVDGTDVIDVSNAGVAAFLTLLIDGVGPLPAAVNGVGFDIKRLRQGYKRHRASRRG